MYKRGISAVVVTIMLVLISILAVVIVWQAIQTIVEEGSEEIGTGFTNINLNLEITNVQVSEEDIKITIKRGAGEGNLESIKIVLYDETESETKDTNEGLQQIETKTYNFNYELEGELIKVEIYPIINGNLGKKADTYQI